MRIRLKFLTQKLAALWYNVSNVLTSSLTTTLGRFFGGIVIVDLGFENIAVMSGCSPSESCKFSGE